MLFTVCLGPEQSWWKILSPRHFVWVRSYACHLDGNIIHINLNPFESCQVSVIFRWKISGILVISKGRWQKAYLPNGVINMSFLMFSCRGIWVKPLAASNEVNMFDTASSIFSTVGNTYFSCFTAWFSLLSTREAQPCSFLTQAWQCTIQFGCVNFFMMPSLSMCCSSFFTSKWQRYLSDCVDCI